MMNPNNNNSNNNNNNETSSSNNCSPYHGFFDCYKNSSLLVPSENDEDVDHDLLVEFLKEKYLQEEEENNEEVKAIVTHNRLDDLVWDTPRNAEISSPRTILVLSLYNLQVIRIWKLRSCHDNNNNNNNNNHREITNGPLARIYSVVMSMEVYDGNQNILVFFYNEYAKIIHQQLSSVTSTTDDHNTRDTKAVTTTLVSLIELPAYKCLIPYPSSKVVLGDCPYCICIGDTSKANVNSNYRMRFDSTKFHLELLSTATNIITSTTAKATTTSSSAAAAAAVAQRQEPSAAEGTDLLCFNRLHISNNGSKHLIPTYTSNNTTNNSRSAASSSNQGTNHKTKSTNTITRACNTTTTERKKYTYLPLCNLASHIQEDVNVYAVVIHFTPPIPTRKGEYSTAITMMDETSTKSSPVTLVIFGLTLESLPQFTVVGDILRAHRVKVQKWQDNIQLVAQSRGHSSFITFRIQPTITGNVNDAKEDTRWELHSTSKHNYTFTISDYQRCHQLWYWGQRQLSLHPLLSSSSNDTPQQQILSIHSLDIATAENTNIHGDLIAMVTAILPTPPNKVTPTSPKGCLRLWDGTGPSLSDAPTLAEYSEAVKVGNDPPLEAILSILKIIRQNQCLMDKPSSCSMSNDDDDDDDNGGDGLLIGNDQQDFAIQPPLAVCGRIINCVVWEQSQWDLLTKGVLSTVSSSMNSSRSTSENTGGIHIGQFIRLRNVTGGVIGSIRIPCLHVHGKSSCTPLIDTMYDIRRILLNHEKRFKRSPPDEYNKNSAVLPATALKVPLSSMTPMWLQSQKYLPRNISASEPIKRPIASISTTSSDDGLTTLLQCFGEPAPASFSVLVSVIGLIPSIDCSSSLPIDFSKLCQLAHRQQRFCRNSRSPLRSLRLSAAASSSSVYHFGFVLKDDTATLDVFVPNILAESLFGVTASKLLCCYQEGEQNAQRDLSKNNIVAIAEQKLKDIVSSGKVFLGQVQSLLVGDHKYYVLESISRACVV